MQSLLVSTGVGSSRAAVRAAGPFEASARAPRDAESTSETVLQQVNHVRSRISLWYDKLDTVILKVLRQRTLRNIYRG
jgi:hypothetical protein